MGIFGFGYLSDRDNNWRINPAGVSWFNVDNVGIGTNSPRSLLTLYQNISPTHSWDAQFIVGGNANVQDDMYAGFGVNQSSGYAFIGATKGGVGGIPFLINPDGGNVGIGTASPSYKLTVAGDIAATTGRVFSLSNPTYSPTYLETWGLSSNGDIYIEPYPGKNLYLTDQWSKTGTLEVQFGTTFFNGGNVGIGTATPGYKLDVMGDINISAGSSFKIGGVPISAGGGTGQWQTSANGIYFNSGNVGIGTNSPTGTLTVYKSEYPLFEVSNSLQKLQISVANNAGDWANGSTPGDVVIRPLALQETDHNGLITIIPNDLNDGKSYIKFGDVKNGLWVGIFNNRIFRVDGLFVANEIKVKVDVWSDYVFNKSYKLPTLKSVEEFINANGHLPEVPSEKKVKEDGVNVAEINAILLKKIEELTLYVIELNKKVKSLEEQNSEIKRNIEDIAH